jgi:hypothetical protein
MKRSLLRCQVGAFFGGGAFHEEHEECERSHASASVAQQRQHQEIPDVNDIAVVPFACRSLTFDGELFWTNYRAKDMIISFVLPNCNGKRTPAPNA